jgi:hypothetical protein
MNKPTAKRHIALLALFLLVEAVLYYLILTTGGNTLRWSSYISIIICFLYALIGVNQINWLLVAGLGFTVCADYCLVICDPIQQLWGMVFFLCTQTLYCAYLHSGKINKVTLTIRFGLAILAEIICVLILREKTDPLAMVSILYYVYLIMNIVDSFLCQRASRLLPVAFILFVLCDTVIGLQVASAGYLPIAEGSALHKIIFSGFNLSWFFYLPSQVSIALSTRKK